MNSLYYRPYKVAVKERIALVLAEELMPRKTVDEAIKGATERLTELFFDEFKYGSKERKRNPFTS